MSDATLYGTDLFGNAIRPTARALLASQFLFPPFTVLNARDGDWQERKRAWTALGIRSELGRGTDLLATGAGSGYAGNRGPKLHSAAPGGAPLPGMNYDKGVRGTPTADGATTTSLFDPVLAELVYRWFSPAGGVIFDPFAGGSVRGVVASSMGRRYYGIELRAEQVEANRAQLDICEGPPPTWITGDSRNLFDLLPPTFAADLVFACPPYADLERYSDDPLDLSTLVYSEFVKAYRAIISDAVGVMRDDSFACFVVGEARGSDGNYYGFVADTIKAFADAGCALYNDAVLITMVGSASLRVSQQFHGSRKMAKTHQNILVFLKGNAKRAAAKCESMRLEVAP